MYLCIERYIRVTSVNRGCWNDDVSDTPAGTPEINMSYRGGSMFGELTTFMPEHVPFTLKVEAKAVTKVNNALILSREKRETLKILFPQLIQHMDQFVNKRQLDSWLSFPARFREEVFEDEGTVEDGAEEEKPPEEVQRVQQKRQTVLQSHRQSMETHDTSATTRGAVHPQAQHRGSAAHGQKRRKGKF